MQAKTKESQLGYQVEIDWSDKTRAATRQVYKTKGEASEAIKNSWEEAYEINLRRMVFVAGSWHVSFLSIEDFDSQARGNHPG